MRCLSVLLTLVLLAGCSGQKKQAELLEQTKPYWLKEHPVSPDYFYGIGITPKIGAPALYEEKAKERALLDISRQIETTINSEAMFIKIEDKQGVHEYLQNRIRTTSAVHLEGYEYVEKWEDLSNVYAFYQLSRAKYKEVKARRKAEAFKLASEKYLAGLQLLKDASHVSAIEHFALAVDALSGYMNESTTTDVQGSSIDLVSESTKQMSSVVQGFAIASNSRSLLPSNFFRIMDEQGRCVVNCPVDIKYSGGYLVNDKVKSNDKGIVAMPELPENNNSSNTLKVRIDLVALGRQVTKNLYVRKIIENQKSASLVLSK